jgi:hypothetical protein
MYTAAIVAVSPYLAAFVAGYGLRALLSSYRRRRWRG